jgi:hypothetical protein
LPAANRAVKPATAGPTIDNGGSGERGAFDPNATCFWQIVAIRYRSTWDPPRVVNAN